MFEVITNLLTGNKMATIRDKFTAEAQTYREDAAKKAADMRVAVEAQIATLRAGVETQASKLVADADTAAKHIEMHLANAPTPYLDLPAEFFEPIGEVYKPE